MACNFEHIWLSLWYEEEANKHLLQVRVEAAILLDLACLAHPKYASSSSAPP